MDIFTSIPNGCKIEKIGDRYKISSVTMQNVKYSASNKQTLQELEQKLEEIDNVLALMKTSDELDSAVTAQFVIEDPDHIIEL